MEYPTGVNVIAAERERQIKGEGWTAEHDDKHVDGELAEAAVCYATPVLIYQKTPLADGGVQFSDPWPFTKEWDGRSRDQFGRLWPNNDNLSVDLRIRNLAKAGALIAAEIDRLNRARGGQ